MWQSGGRMTATQATGSSPAEIDDGVLVPEMCRITVAARSVEVDIALPASVPIGRLLPTIVSLVSDRAGDDGVTTAGRTISWALAPIGSAPLPPGRSLGDSAVRDGDVLLLTDADQPNPPALYDDIANAYVDVVNPRRWTASDARHIGYLAAATGSIVLATAVALAPDGSIVGPALGLLIAVLLVVGGIAVDRAAGDAPTGAVIAACAGLPAFAGAAGILPGSDAAASALAGFALVCALAAVCRRALACGYPAATAMLVFCGVMACWSALVTADITTARIGAAAAVAVALVLLMCGPRLAIFAAGLAVPDVPRTPPPDAAEPIDDDPFDEDIQVLTTRSDRADEFLTGHLAGAGAATAIAVLGTIIDLPWATPLSAAIGGPSVVDRLASPHPAGLLLAGVVALMLTLRARSYVGAGQVAALIVPAAIIVSATAVGLVVGRPDLWWVTVIGAVASMTVALVLGTVAPRRTFPPTARRAVEYLELAATAAVVPVLFWVAGLFALVRNL